MDMNWEDDFSIKVSVADQHTVLISANNDGLVPLANPPKALANEDTGSHIHYDEYNSLEEGSSELIIEKID